MARLLHVIRLGSLQCPRLVLHVATGLSLFDQRRSQGWAVPLVYRTTQMRVGVSLGFLF